MSSLPFLLDEDVPEFLADELVRLEPAVTTLQVGMEGAPSKGMKDPQLLIYAEQNRLTLVSMDKRTMPTHLAEHFLQARNTWGVFLLRQGFPIARYGEDLILIWSSLADQDLEDNTLYLPLQ